MIVLSRGGSLRSFAVISRPRSRDRLSPLDLIVRVGVVAGRCTPHRLTCTGSTSARHFYLGVQDSFHIAVRSRVDPSRRRMRLCCSDTLPDLSVDASGEVLLTTKRLRAQHYQPG
jgi:hypothetical protein